MTQRIQQLVDHRAFQYTILGLIVLASVLVGLETSREIMDRYGSLIYALDKLVVYLFAAEALLKMAAHGKRFYRYFTDPWNVFDFVIVVVCLLPLNGHFAAVLRLVRILRALRVISVVPKLQLLVRSLLHSLPSMIHVGLLLTLLFYIYAVLGVFLWRDNDPVHFRDLGTAMLSLFRVITLEDWTDIMYIQMKGSSGYEFTPAEYAIIDAYPAYAPQAQPLLGIIYFVSFVLLGTMVMLNLVIGVIINSMHEVSVEVMEEEQKPVNPDQRLMELEDRLEEATRILRSLRASNPEQDKHG